MPRDLPRYEGNDGSEWGLKQWPDTARIPRHQLDPLYHGDHGQGLYGLFSIVNALRLALAHRRPFTPREIDDLIDVGLRFLELRIGLRRGVVGAVRLELWLRMAQALVEHVARTKRVPLGLQALGRHEDRVSRADAFSMLEATVRKRRLMLMLRRGGLYTVVTGYTAYSLLLFDSGGGGWISKRLTGVPGDSANTRHIIYPASFLALSY